MGVLRRERILTPVQGHSFQWTSYNMVASIAQGSISVGLAYGSEHQRYKMCAPNCTSPTTTTLYLNDPVTGAMSEKAVSGSTGTFRDYIVADGQIVAARVNVGGAITWKYVTPDHLGSVATATSVPGNGGIERDSYDAWGKRRNPDASDDPGCTLSSVIPRGFTGHEMLDRFCLVNMNGRIYDPGLARFLSADSIVPNPFSFHGYQRYAYVNNNPLNATDPSGHFELRDSEGRIICIECSYGPADLSDWGPGFGNDMNQFDHCGSDGCYARTGPAAPGYIDPQTGMETVPLQAGASIHGRRFSDHPASAWMLKMLRSQRPAETVQKRARNPLQLQRGIVTRR